MPRKGSYWDVPWRHVDLTEPPEGEDHDPVAIVHGKRRLEIAYSPAESYWMLRTRSFPVGTKAIRTRDGAVLRIQLHSWEEAEWARG